MKKKSPRGIPDFSSKGPKSMPLEQRELLDNKPRPHSAVPKTKPPATSVKFGRRGA